MNDDDKKYRYYYEKVKNREKFATRTQQYEWFLFFMKFFIGILVVLFIILGNIGDHIK